MKKSLYIALFLMALACCQGCKVNNGDIGLLYGTWFLDRMEVDGQQYDGWRTPDREDTFFSFQNNICFITYVDAHHQGDSRVSTWEWVDEDKVISLDFTHTDNRFPEPVPDGYLYGAPGWLLLTESTVYNFDVRYDGDKRMVWSTVNTEGQHLTFYLQKTW